MTSNSKVLLICLDSAEPALLRAWGESGALPVLSELRRTGVWADVNNVPGFGNGGFWPTFYTGANPGRHGCYFQYQIEPGRYRLRRMVHSADLGVEPFWSCLSRAGQRIFVVDMIEATVFPGANGVQIANWMTHRRVGPPESSPADLLSQVVGQYGDDPFRGEAERPRRGASYFEDLSAGMETRIASKTDMCCDFLGQGGWDLFVAGFGEPHDVGHVGWHLHDPEHPWHDAAYVRRFGDPLLKVYTALDRAIGRLIGAAGSEATVVLFTGPGFGPNYTANFMLDEILTRLEAGSREVRPGAVDRLKLGYRRLLPERFRKRVQRATRQLGANLDLGERRRRKCFAIPHADNAGAIRINMVGREPQGLVQPGADYDAYCDRLTEALLEIVNLDTGNSLVEKVVRSSEVCHGDRLSLLPDLLVVWRREGMVTRVGSPEIGELRGRYSGRRSGDHTPNGAVLVRGQGVRPGELPQALPLTAIAPSIAGMLGVAMPAADSAPVPALVPAADVSRAG